MREAKISAPSAERGCERRDENNRRKGFAGALFVKKSRLREFEKILFSKLGVRNAEGMFRIYGHLTTEEVESQSAKELLQRTEADT